MKRVFDRYILKEIASPFAIGLLVYTFTLLINQILILSKTLIAKGATAGTIFKILLYLLPDLLSFTIPMATLMGVLAGMSRLSSDSEIVAFRTMGVRNRQLLKPVLLFSVATWLVSSWLIMYLAPEANYRFNKLYTEVVLSQTISGIKPGVFYQGLPFLQPLFPRPGARRRLAGRVPLLAEEARRGHGDPRPQRPLHLQAVAKGQLHRPLRRRGAHASRKKTRPSIR